MTWRKALTGAQIRATLERHGFAPDTAVVGVRYGDICTVNIYGARLIVPTDVLNMRTADDEESERQPLFDHGAGS